MRVFEISLSDVQISNTVPSTIVATLYVTFPGLIYFKTASLYLRSLHPFPPPSGFSSFQQPLSNQQNLKGKDDTICQVHLFGVSLHSKILAPESSLPRSSMMTSNRSKIFFLSGFPSCSPWRVSLKQASPPLPEVEVANEIGFES